MATKKANPAMDFLVAELKKNRKSAYADIKGKADKKKLKLYPIMFGRAQALLGIVKSAKRGQGKAAKAKARKAAGRRGPGRPRKAASAPAMEGLQGILAAVQNSEGDRAAMRAALERIQGIIADVLA